MDAIWPILATGVVAIASALAPQLFASRVEARKWAREQQVVQRVAVEQAAVALLAALAGFGSATPGGSAPDLGAHYTDLLTRYYTWSLVVSRHSTPGERAQITQGRVEMEAWRPQPANLIRSLPALTETVMTITDAAHSRIGAKTL